MILRATMNMVVFSFFGKSFVGLTISNLVNPGNKLKKNTNVRKYVRVVKSCSFWVLATLCGIQSLPQKISCNIWVFAKKLCYSLASSCYVGSVGKNNSWQTFSLDIVFFKTLLNHGNECIHGRYIRMYLPCQSFPHHQSDG